MSLKASKQLMANQARIGQAVATTRKAYEGKLPQLSASGSYLYLNSPTVDLKIKTNNNTGGGTGEASTAKINQLMYATVNASLPIYTGGKIRYGIESSRLLEKAARLDAGNEREAVIQNTIEAYNNLYKAQAAIGLVDSNLADARRRVQDYTRLEQNGLLARNDLLKAQLQESNTEATLLDARTNWQLAEANMTIMLGLPDTAKLFIGGGDLKPASGAPPLADLLQQALLNRKDLQSLDNRRQAAQTGVKAARADALPSLALTSAYTALNVPHAITVINAVSIGLGVKYDIANLWKHGDADLAKAQVKEAEALQAQLTDAVRLQIVQAYNTYLSSQKKIDVYTKAIAQAEENYAVVSNKFNNGLATVTEVLDADIARLQQQLNHAFAISDTYVAYHKLLQSAGLLQNTLQPTQTLDRSTTK